MSTINLQITARHKAARITDAEHRSAPVLFRNTELSQHILRRPVAPTLRVFFEQSFDHGSRDVAGGDGVDADAVGAPFRGEVATELQDGGFGGVVSRADEALFNYVSVVSSKHTVRKWIERIWKLTRLATEPLMEAIMAMLPPLPQRIISFATAWAVMKTPVTLTSNIMLESAWV